MKLSPWYLTALTPFALIDPAATYLGHLAVLAVTVGIFFGTLSLGGTLGGTSPPPVPSIPPAPSITTPGAS